MLGGYYVGLRVVLILLPRREEYRVLATNIVHQFIKRMDTAMVFETNLTAKALR
ncbi:hypothetical protein NIES4072_27710 [Nostoc commune NIES-4072]|uniref:Uncharacterized protein n=1 Tax=Nostoc commune NIES-4072 TaxID=2005467 RepID=A0A2R5FTV5_NOSCO|nr:hypothetical protein NIES4070_63030 [Nostoc commune HK-02]GBG19104.1 hypothetical protein NIES4072_27710 [Nostoc commune NIES-4072]